MTPGDNHLCLTVNATTDTITLHKNGVASASAGGQKTVTSYTLAGDFDLGRIADLTNGGGGTFDDLIVEFTDELIGGHLIFGGDACKDVPAKIFKPNAGDDTTNPHGTRTLLVVYGISAGVDVAHGFPQKIQRTHQGIR